MKKLTVVLGILLLAGTILAQVPQSFKYQAIARDVEGNVLSEHQISLRINLLEESKTGQAVYSETHNLRTNQFGLINLEIGMGKNKTGDLSTVKWESGKYFVNIEIDVNGGTDYVSMGVSQLLSVPYALYAERSGSGSGSGSSSGSSAKEANSWTEATGVTYLTNPNNLGVGTTTPGAKLHVNGTAVNAIFERNLNNIGAATNRFYKSRGTTAAKTPVLTNDYMGSFQWWGYTSDGTFNYGAILGSRAENVGSSDVAGNFVFLTTNNSYSYAERMRLTADGWLGIGTNAPAGILDIAGAYHFPNTDGTSGQVLQTNGSGALTWNDDDGATSINGLSDGKTGGNSVFLGSNAGANDDGTDNLNVGVGVNALEENISGTLNTAVGYISLRYNTSVANTALGAKALSANTSGQLNTASGYSALEMSTTGDYNTAYGAYAAYYNRGGSRNTTIGYGANFYNQTGSNNTMLGFEAGGGPPTHSKSGCVFIGNKAGFNETGSNKLYIANSDAPLIYGDFATSLFRIYGTLDINGAYQFPGFDGSSGQILQTDGNGVLTWNDDGGATSINGLSDGKTTGNSVFLGLGSGTVDDGTTNNNVGVGEYSLNSNLSGYYNTSIGYQSQFQTNTGSNNTSSGFRTLRENTSGSYNTATGSAALYFNSTASYNTAIGASALYSHESGNCNTSVGRSSGYLNITGSSNVFLGYQAGYNETGSSKLYIDNSSTATPLIWGDFINNDVNINGYLGINNDSPTYELDIDVGSTGGIRTKSTGDSYIIIDKGSNTDDAYVAFRTGGTTRWTAGAYSNEDFRIKNWSLGGTSDNSFVMDVFTSAIALNKTDPSSHIMLGLYPGDDFTDGLYIDMDRTTSTSVTGIEVDIDNTSTASDVCLGVISDVRKTSASNASIYGLHAFANDDQTGTSTRHIYGLYATASVASTNGTSSSYGVYGFATGLADNEYGVYYSGNLGGSGAKSAIIRTDDGPKHVYCQESPGNWFEDFGDGAFKGGKAIVKIAKDYLQSVTINTQHPMKVFLSPTSQIGEYWIEKQNNQFIVHAPHAANGATFDFRIVAKRKDFEDVRMAKAPAAYTDHYLYPDINDVPEEYRAEWVRMVSPEDRDPAWNSYLSAEEQKELQDITNQ